MEKEYLTEKKLGEFVEEAFDKEFIKDRSIKETKTRFRADLYQPELRLCIEFDGSFHFTNPRVIYNDAKKDAAYMLHNIRVVRIPYFVQLTTQTIKHYFGLDVEYQQQYPHGFIDKKAILPAAFCGLGYARYQKAVCSLPENVRLDIFDSLKTKHQELGSEDLVYFHVPELET